MALKPDRDEHYVDVSFFYSSGAVERGIVMCHNTVGSGAALDQSEAEVVVPTGTNMIPVGVLLNDVVNLDLTRQKLNPHQDEVQNGGKVALLKQGWIVTNMIKSGATIAAGAAAHYNTDGEFTEGTSSIQVGRFMSTADEDGYAKVEISITD